MYGDAVNDTSVLNLWCVCDIWCLDLYLFRPGNSFGILFMNFKFLILTKLQERYYINKFLSK